MKKLGPHINDSTEFFFLAISMLEMEGKTNMIPELLQIFTPKQMILMTQILGGKLVRFPSTRDLSISLKSALLAYETGFNGMPLSGIREDLDVSDSDFKLILDKVDKWKQRVSSEVGSNLFDTIIGATP